MRQLYSPVLVLVLGAAPTACTDRSDVGAFGPDAAASEGGGASDDGGDASAPLSITLKTSTTAIAAGGLSTCAIDANGGAVCWGDNQHGALGIGGFDPATSQAPLSVAGLTKGVRAVAGGTFAQCAILADGTARCWGDSLFGDIGGTIESAQQPTPHDKTGLSNDVARIGFGSSFACALTTSGRGKCWGLGGSGQLGTGSTNDEYAARDIQNTLPLVDISPAMGGFFACAVTNAGQVLCWGKNSAGQLGSNGTTDQSKPVAVVGLDSAATNVVSGSEHACALLSDGAVACWGSDAKGQLGRGSVGSAGPNVPTRVTGVTGVTYLAAGGNHTCVITGGRAVCWGANDAAQIAAGAAVLKPTEIAPASFMPIAVTAGLMHTCVLGAPRTLKCVGDASRMQTGAGIFGL